MNLGIQGKKALVFGSAGGLGAAIVQSLVAEGAAVVAVDRNNDDENLTGVVPGSVTRRFVDLDNVTTALKRVEVIVEELSGVDILVNITGGPPSKPTLEITVDDWRERFDSMVLSVIEVTRIVSEHMVANGWGRIITCLSSGVVTPIPNLTLSNGLRASLLPWSKGLANELGPRGVTVNTVIPGRIDTKRVRQLDEIKANRTGQDAVAVAEQSQASIPLRRYGEPQEFGDVVAFLASHPASYITGSSIRVDGGLIPSI